MCIRDRTNVDKVRSQIFSLSIWTSTWRTSWMQRQIFHVFFYSFFTNALLKTLSNIVLGNLNFIEEVRIKFFVDHRCGIRIQHLLRAVWRQLQFLLSSTLRRIIISFCRTTFPQVRSCYLYLTIISCAVLEFKWNIRKNIHFFIVAISKFPYHVLIPLRISIQLVWLIFWYRHHTDG